MHTSRWALLALATLPLTGLTALSAAALPAAVPSAPALTQQASPVTRWYPPVGFTLHVLRAFDPPAHRFAAGHRGFDLAAQVGSSVIAPTSGTVTFAGRVVDRDVVSVRVDQATVVSLEPVTSGLSAGDAVAGGDLLGVVSLGGHCDASCVHLGVRVDDEYVNPMRFFRDKPRLLPWE